MRRPGSRVGRQDSWSSGEAKGRRKRWRRRTRKSKWRRRTRRSRWKRRMRISRWRRRTRRVIIKVKWEGKKSNNITDDKEIY